MFLPDFCFSSNFFVPAWVPAPTSLSDGLLLGNIRWDKSFPPHVSFSYGVYHVEKQHARGQRTSQQMCLRWDHHPVCSWPETETMHIYKSLENFLFRLSRKVCLYWEEKSIWEGQTWGRRPNLNCQSERWGEVWGPATSLTTKSHLLMELQWPRL